MHSLSVVLGGRTALAREFLAVADPAEIVVLIGRNPDEVAWLKSRYPWFTVLNGWERDPTLPDTRGPVRIFWCSVEPPHISDIEVTDYCRAMFADLGMLRRLLERCRLLPVHIALVSSASAVLPYPHSMCALTIETAVEALCANRRQTVLSVFYPGRLVDRRTGSSAWGCFYTSQTRLARLMIKAATSESAQRRLVGIDARIELFAARCRKWFHGISSGRQEADTAAKETAPKISTWSFARHPQPRMHPTGGHPVSAEVARAVGRSAAAR